MLTETKRPNVEAAYQLGWMAYERGDYEPFPDGDTDFIALCDDGANVNALRRAYKLGYEDAMRASISE